MDWIEGKPRKIVALVKMIFLAFKRIFSLENITKQFLIHRFFKVLTFSQKYKFWLPFSQFLLLWNSCKNLPLSLGLNWGKAKENSGLSKNDIFGLWKIFFLENITKQVLYCPDLGGTDCNSSFLGIEWMSSHAILCYLLN